MREVIPVLFTSANHLTPAHVEILKTAAKNLQAENYLVKKAIISPVNDNYIKIKHYPPVELNEKQYPRILFTGEERIALAETTIKDFDKNEGLSIEINQKEIQNTKLEDLSLMSNPNRDYIEHWEMLRSLQKEEIDRCKKTNEKPALYVLVCGADLANGMMNNWAKYEGVKGMPFRAATRGKVKATLNTISPTAYLQRLGYNGDKDKKEHDETFNNFKSGFFEFNSKEYSSLSSTKIAACDPTAVNLLGDSTFDELINILDKHTSLKSDTLNQQDQLKNIQKYKTTEYDTAKATLESFERLAIEGRLNESKSHSIHNYFSKKEKNNYSNEIKTTQSDLLEIVCLLKKNIEARVNKKGVSGCFSFKLKDETKLKALDIAIDYLKHTVENKKVNLPEFELCISFIMSIAALKRNPIHFFGTPHSVNEFNALLKEKKIGLPNKVHSFSKEEIFSVVNGDKLRTLFDKVKPKLKPNHFI